VAIGQSETLTATLGTTAATGSVTFRIGSVTLGTGTVSNGVATLTLAASVANGFTVPSVTITATYNGDSSYSPVTNTMALTVNQASTTTAVTTSGSTFGGSVTLTATITPIYAGTVTGTVWFYVGSTSVGRTTPSSNTATLILNATAANSFALGANSITATYSGDTNYTGSNSLASTLTLTATTTTAVTVGSSSIALGSTQSFTATVTSAGGTPTGTVTFSVGGISQSPVTLSGGTATLSSIAPTTANGFTVGTDTVTATYTPATGSYFNSSSNTNTFTVTAPAYTITPASSSVTLTPGNSTTVGVTLTSSGFAGSISWTATPSSGLITVSPSSGTATLTANDPASISLNIGASSSATNRHPRLPWTIGGGVFAAMLAGLPLLRRRKRVLAILLTALAVASLAFALSCSGGSKAPRSYTVVITGTGGISSTIGVTVN
jgi:hypothetical protein